MMQGTHCLPSKLGTHFTDLRRIEGWVNPRSWAQFWQQYSGLTTVPRGSKTIMAYEKILWTGPLRTASSTHTCCFEHIQHNLEIETMRELWRSFRARSGELHVRMLSASLRDKMTKGKKKREEDYGGLCDYLSNPVLHLHKSCKLRNLRRHYILHADSGNSVSTR